jgi:hypothetical protein
METNFVKKSIYIKTNIEKTWSKLNKISKLDWLPEQKSTKFLTDKKRGVGTVRLISFEDGSEVEEHIVGWSPKKYFSYIATSGLPVNAYHATISIIEFDNAVRVTWESYFSSKGTKSEFANFTKFLSAFYTLSLKNLKNSLEK